MITASGDFFAACSVTLRDDVHVYPQQIVAAHARLARRTRGDDHHVRASGRGIVIGASDRDIVADDRTGLGQIERLALG